jgi:hypothetical protein
MREDDILRIIGNTREYRDRASRYLQNYEWEMEKGDREKAGEALWGVISCLINALYLLEKGKPSTKHRESSRFAKEFMTSRFEEEDSKEFANTYEKVERFHANFYHAFLSEEEFKEIAGDVLRLVEYLDRILSDMLSKIEDEIKSASG